MQMELIFTFKFSFKALQNESEVHFYLPWVDTYTEVELHTRTAVELPELGESACQNCSLNWKRPKNVLVCAQFDYSYMHFNCI